MGVKQFVQYELPGKIDDLNNDLSLIGGDMSDLSDSIDTELGELQLAIDGQITGLDTSLTGVVNQTKADLTGLINSLNVAVAAIKPAVKSVQRGVAAIPIVSAKGFVEVIISSVNISKSMLIVGSSPYEDADCTIIASTFDMHGANGRIVSETKISFAIWTPMATTPQYIPWEVIEYN